MKVYTAVELVPIKLLSNSRGGDGVQRLNSSERFKLLLSIRSLMLTSEDHIPEPLHRIIYPSHYIE
jgi:hypothetical protein